MALQASFGITNDWQSGFQAGLSLDAGATAFQGGWSIEFDADFAITQLWNGVILSHVGNHYVIGNAAWNGSLAAGGHLDVGFLGGTGARGVSNLQVHAGSTPPPPPPPPLPSLSIADATITEGDAGTKQMVFTIALSAANAAPVTLHWATAEGTAKAGSDFAAASGDITIAAGQTSAQVSIAILGDTSPEATESFRLLLSNAAGATLADAEASGTILDNDPAPPPPPPSGDTASYRIANDWGSGFVGEVNIQNDATAMAGWRVEFDAGFEIGNIWNARIISHTGTHYVVGDAGWNGNLGANAATSFGFQAAGSGSHQVSGLTLNGGGGTPALPAITIADAPLAEGNAGGHDMVFTLSLSAASATPVTLHWATADGTAHAGSDYTAGSGTVTFAAGQTQQTLHVGILGDTSHEANEQFQLLLSAASGATIADASATGTILDDDAAPPPAGGFLATSGNQIIDSTGHAFRITGVNWFGMETNTFSPHGLHARNLEDMMDQMAQLGFNTIRLPFSDQLFDAGSTPGGIDYTLNPGLVGLDGLGIMDRIVAHAGEIGLRIILDHHRSAAGGGPNGNGLWYDSGYSEQRWISDWQMLADRYAGNPTVIGADLANEPHNGSWGDGSATDWAAAAERAGNAILAKNPDWLIFVEGTGSYQGASTWWGGQLAGAAAHPVQFDVANRLVYSPHDYGNSVFPQSWFSDPGFPANLPAIWDSTWGYIFQQNIAPVMLGEFGTRLQDPKDAPWLKTLLAYLGGDFDIDGTQDIPADQLGMGWSWWSWNPNSGDTGGILMDDWKTPIAEKLALLQPQMFG